VCVCDQQLPTTHLAHVFHEQDDDTDDMLLTSPEYYELMTIEAEREKREAEREKREAERVRREAERIRIEAEEEAELSKMEAEHSKKKASFLKQLSEKFELDKREHQKQQDIAEQVEMKTKIQSQIDVMETQLKDDLALLSEQSATAQHQNKAEVMAAEQVLTEFKAAVKAQHTAALEQIEKDIIQEQSAAMIATIQAGVREVQTLRLFNEKVSSARVNSARVVEFEEKREKRISRADTDHAKVIQQKELEKDADIAASKTKLAATEAKISTDKKALEVKHSAQVVATKQAGESQLKALQSKQTDLQDKALKEEADAHAVIRFNNAKRKSLQGTAERNVKARVNGTSSATKVNGTSSGASSSKAAATATATTKAADSSSGTSETTCQEEAEVNHVFHSQAETPMMPHIEHCMQMQCNDSTGGLVGCNLCERSVHTECSDKIITAEGGKVYFDCGMHEPRLPAKYRDRLTAAKTDIDR
jgi:hypothetical protein